MTEPENAADLNARLVAVEAFDRARVLCIGDVMLDRFIYGEVSRISPEAPIPVMARHSEQAMLGGAGNVLRNMVALGAQCCFISVIGDDATGHMLTRLIGEQPRVEPYLICEQGRISTEKMRFISGTQQLLRCDQEESSAIQPETEARLLAILAEALPHYDLVVLSDYAKGVLSDRVLRETIRLARESHKPVLIDPKRDRIEAYRGATLLSPNMGEWSRMLNMAAIEAGEMREQARLLCEQFELEAMLITRGKDGMDLIDAQGGMLHHAAQAREVFDVSGAGDTVMATLAVAHASGCELALASECANIAAGIVVGRAGTACVYRTDLKAALHQLGSVRSHAKIASLSMAEAMVANWREEGYRVGMTNGCFDLLHVGHLQSLQHAKEHCDRLIVAINSDSSVKRLKGEQRPLNTEMDRAALLAGLACVDLVVIFREDTPLALIELLRPDVLMKGADYEKSQVVGADYVEAYGGQIVLLPLKDGHSSTRLIERVTKAS